ncbi:MAG: tetratricopeptide repeat protein [Planctomycetota bacterium]
MANKSRAGGGAAPSGWKGVDAPRRSRTELGRALALTVGCGVLTATLAPPAGALELSPLDLTSTAGPAVPLNDEVAHEHEVASALAYGPLVAESLQSSARITLVASRSSAAESRTVHALIEQPGKLVSWVKLPMTELPESALIVSDDRFVCVTRLASGDTELVTLDSSGKRHARTLLSGLLPDRAQRTEEPVSLSATPMGPCLTVPLACGTLALVEMTLDVPAATSTFPMTPAVAGSASVSLAADPFFRVCSVILSTKHACGVDAWLAQARQLDRDGDAEAARFALEAAIETDPQDARGYRELAIFHRRRGAVQEQLSCLQTGVERLHADAIGHADDDWQVGTPAARLVLDYVQAAHKGDDVAMADEALHLALTLYPCMEQVVLLRAEALLEEGAPEAAVASLRAALAQLDPNADLAAATHDAGRFLRRKGCHADALLLLEDAFALGDDSDFLLRTLADVSIELDRPGRAAEWLTRLATRWRSAKNGESEASRSRRAEERLAELDDEIAVLLQASAAPGD